SLVPPALQGVTREQFLQRLGEFDQPMSERLKKAQAAQQVLRFAGTFHRDGQARVALEALPTRHAFARSQGTDNIVLFKTKRNFEQAMVIEGRGAGPEVTAGGVFADLLRLTRYLGAVQ